MRKVDVVTIGSAIKDILIYSPEIEVLKNSKDLKRQKLFAVEYGAKLEIDDEAVTTAIGGGAVNVGLSLRQLGLTVAPLIRVGMDVVGREIVEALKRRRLITSLVQYDRKVATGFSVILNSSIDREHTIFTYKAASKHLVAPNVKKIKTAWFYFSPLSMKNWWDFFAPFVAQVKATAKKSPKSRVRIAWNPGSKQLLAYKRMLPLLPFVDILILNKDEAIEFVTSVWKKRVTKRQLNKVEFLLEKIKSLGVTNLVITDGVHGATGIDADNKFYHRASVPAKIMDTVGAGDAFAAGFLANFSRTENFSRALYAGVKNSALVLSGVGNRRLHEVK